MHDGARTPELSNASVAIEACIESTSWITVTGVQT